MSTPMAATDASFPQMVPAEGMVVIDFWAPWCGPCRQFAPVFEKSASANPDVLHLKVDVDENPALAQYFQVSSIPTTVFVRDRITVGAVPGALPPLQLADLISQVRRLDMDEVRQDADAS